MRKSPCLNARIAAVNKALSLGYNVRLCFDPIIQTDNSYEIYSKFMEKVKQEIDFYKIHSMNAGAFRVPENYYKTMKKLNPDCEIYKYPMNIADNTVTYKSEDIDAIFNIVNITAKHTKHTKKEPI